MNKELQLQVRKASCTLCPLSGFVDDPGDICITGSGKIDADILVVTKMPDSPKYRALVSKELKAVGIEPERVMYTGAVKCQTWERQPGRKDIKTCSSNFLDREIKIVKPKYILALGNEALQATAGKSGITKYRGQIFEYGVTDVKVFPTVSPSMVLRNPRYREGWVADLAFFGNLVKGKKAQTYEVDYTYVNSKELLRELQDQLKAAELISYDVETNGFEEFLPQSAIITLSITMMMPGKPHDPVTYVIPLYHPQSPFRKQWRKVLRILAPDLISAKKHIAHNGKFDDRWLNQFGVDTKCTFDTMLAAHLLDENRAKGLKNLARTVLGAPAWDIETKNLLSTPLDKVVHYNAHDTYYTYQLYLVFREQLLEQPRIARLFQRLMMPASQDLTKAEMRGIWTDRERLFTNAKVAYDTLAEIEQRLLEYVPEEIPADLPQNKRTGDQVNFNASNFARWWLFTHLQLPVLKRGKKKDDGRPGDPSMAEEILLELRDAHPVVPIMLERVKWQKFCSSFFDPYQEQINEDDRIHTTFKLHGTVTGRLSSGKEDEEKVTSKVQRRGVNLQQVPRDPFVRGVFGAPPGWTFVEADFSQIELRVVAFLSRDPRMLMIYQTGQDIHTITAASTLGVPLSQVTKDERKKAKAVNFGFVYGMGAPKFVHTAFTKYDLRFSVEEAQEIRKAFFQEYSNLPRWHAKQRRLANKYKRVSSPLGRIRHLPDIDSSDRGVKGEAERQAINSPVQSFASDLTQLSMILVNRKLRRLGIEGYVIGTVHDSLLFEIRDDYVAQALPIIKDTMEHLPLKRLFGVEVDLPIISDIGVGRNWGQCIELTPEQVYDYDAAVLAS